MKLKLIGLTAKILAFLLPTKVMRSKQYFNLWETKGYHITPVQFYESVPDTRDFKRNIFENDSNLLGIEINEQGQINLLEDFQQKYKNEYSEFRYGKSENKNDFYFYNNSFETVDAEILYCMIRKYKPQRIIEIGSGFSTLLTARAIRQNRIEDSKYICELICIEPYPSEWIEKIPEVKKIIKSKVENIQLSEFENLKENDILFIDSSHVINIYNDVCFEYLDVLPSLNIGVIVHIHDILMPQKYSESWYEQKYFWNEQYLLQAFLAFNTSFSVMWSGNYMHLKYPTKLDNAFISYSKFKSNKDRTKNKQGHKSFWIQRIK